MTPSEVEREIHDLRAQIGELAEDVLNSGTPINHFEGVRYPRATGPSTATYPPQACVVTNDDFRMVSQDACPLPPPETRSPTLEEVKAERIGSPSVTLLRTIKQLSIWYRLNGSAETSGVDGALRSLEAVYGHLVCRGS